jgi:hypothetical protein
MHPPGAGRHHNRVKESADLLGMISSDEELYQLAVIGDSIRSLAVVLRSSARYKALQIKFLGAWSPSR